MTPTLKQQLEQWIDREAADYEASLEREIKYLSENDIDHRYTDNAIDDFKAGASSILPMLLVALEALEFVINHSMPSTYNNEEAHKVLNKIKSMMEGNGND